MGAVYRARQESLGREVALKLLREAADPGGEVDRRFRREMMTMTALDHPGLVRILDGGVESGVPFIAMELVEGKALRAIFEKNLRAPWTVALALAARLGEALAYLHERGVLHRDLSPGNVFLTPDGGVKILDFGLARTHDATVLTAPGQVVGTPAVMAPELLSVGAHAPASDLWAVGCLLYQLLTGRPPYAAPTPAELLMRITSRDAEAPRALVPEIPEAASKLCVTLLSRDPALRGPPAAELAARCEEALGAAGTSVAQELAPGVLARLSAAPPARQRPTAPRRAQSGGAASPSPPPGMGVTSPRAARARARGVWALAFAFGAGLAAAFFASRQAAPVRDVPATPSAPVALEASAPASARPLLSSRWREFTELEPVLRAGGERAKVAVKKLKAALPMDLSAKSECWLHWFEVEAWLADPKRGPAPPRAASSAQGPMDIIDEQACRQRWSMLQPTASPEALGLALRWTCHVPDDGRTWLLLAWALECEGRGDAAKLLYALALQRMDGLSLHRFPETAGRAFARAMFSVPGNHLEETWESYIAIQDDFNMAWIGFLDEVQRSGREMLMDRLVAKSPHGQRVRMSVAQLKVRHLNRTGRYRELLTYMESVVEKMSGYSTFIDQLVQEFAVRGDRAGVDRYVQRLPRWSFVRILLLNETPERRPGKTSEGLDASVLCAHIFARLLAGDAKGASTVWATLAPHQIAELSHSIPPTTVELFGEGGEATGLEANARAGLTGVYHPMFWRCWETAAGAYHGPRTTEVARQSLATLRRETARGSLAPMIEAIWHARGGRHAQALTTLSGRQDLDVAVVAGQTYAAHWVVEILTRPFWLGDPEAAKHLARGRSLGLLDGIPPRMVTYVDQVAAGDFETAAATMQELRQGGSYFTLAILVESWWQRRRGDRAARDRWLRTLDLILRGRGASVRCAPGPRCRGSGARSCGRARRPRPSAWGPRTVSATSW
jgi:hypothetical protein